MAPWPFAYAEGSRKSMNPPKTRKGAFGFFLGYSETNDSPDTAAATRMSLPTFPHLRVPENQFLSRIECEKHGNWMVTYVSFTPEVFGNSCAISVSRSESMSRPPVAPGTIQPTPSVRTPFLNKITNESVTHSCTQSRARVLRRRRP